MMDGRRTVALGAALGGLGVALGAFGAHGLRSRVPEDLLAVFEVGVRYHLVHALAIVAAGLLAILAERSAPGGTGGVAASGTGSGPGGAAAGAVRAAIAFAVGVAIFSGSLYLLTLTGLRWLGAVTPIGGVAFIVGWLLLARAALREG
ncbi:MAG: DUF423 domain-containing protein [Alphaproteobacteria bacterium]